MIDYGRLDRLVASTLAGALGGVVGVAVVLLIPTLFTPDARVAVVMIAAGGVVGLVVGVWRELGRGAG